MKPMSLPKDSSSVSTEIYVIPNSAGEEEIEISVTNVLSSSDRNRAFLSWTCESWAISLL